MKPAAPKPPAPANALALTMHDAGRAIGFSEEVVRRLVRGKHLRAVLLPGTKERRILQGDLAAYVKRAQPAEVRS